MHLIDHGLHSDTTTQQLAVAYALSRWDTVDRKSVQTPFCALKDENKTNQYKKPPQLWIDNGSEDSHQSVKNMGQ